jgi:hypothetical protein
VAENAARKAWKSYLESYWSRSQERINDRNLKRQGERIRRIKEMDIKGWGN